MVKKTVLLIGSGGREHALAWKLSQSPLLEKLYIVPGNPGTAQVGENFPIPATSIRDLVIFAREKRVNFVVVGPDDPLAMGAVDEFRDAGVPVFGPTKKAAELEWSKAFSKALMESHNIPTARFKTFTAFESAKAYLESGEIKLPIVIKASGLALGKGVTIAATMEEAEKALREAMVDKIFGESGETVVIEEFLNGQEISIHAISDGLTFKVFPSAQDHKRAFDNDQGPNTGGVGTIAPLPWVTDADMKNIETNIVEPTFRGMKSSGRTFTGLLFPGLMMTADGPKVLEFNARFGDPEAQSYMRLLKTDLLELLLSCVEGKLSEQKIEWHPGYTACIVLASGGYPGNYEKGKKINGIEEAEKISGVKVFHAGTKYENGEYYTSGGRVLGVTALAETLEKTLEIAYNAVQKINFEGMQYRKDIGAKSLKK